MLDMKRFWTEFKAFSIKGNMLDLAVAVVLGTAFTAVITALVKNVIMPAVSYVQPAGGGYKTWQIGKIEIGAFLGEVVNFLIIALVLFIVIVKIVGSIRKHNAPPPEPTTKECPLCCSTIPARAVKCPQCTGDIGKPGETKK